MSQNNHVQLTGRLGKEPDVIQLKEGIMLAFSIATTDYYHDDGGFIQQKQAVWHKALVFDEAVIELAKGFKKGARIQVEGELSYKPFEVPGKNKKTYKKNEASIVVQAIRKAPVAVAETEAPNSVEPA